MVRSSRKMTGKERSALSDEELKAYSDARVAARINETNRSRAAVYKVLRQRHHPAITVELVHHALSGGGADPNNPDAECIFYLGTLLEFEIMAHEELLDAGETHISRRPDRLPRSLIAYLAVELLERCIIFETDGYITSSLLKLVRCLLGTEGYGLNEVRHPSEECIAAIHVANEPNIGTTALAKKIGVDKATVSRWRNDPLFHAKINNLMANQGTLQWYTSLLKDGYKFDPEIDTTFC